MPVAATPEFKAHCLEVYDRLGNAEEAAKEIGNVSACAILKWYHDDYDRAAMQKCKLAQNWPRPWGMAYWHHQRRREAA